MNERTFRHRTRWQIAMRYCGLFPATRTVGHALASFTNTEGQTVDPPSLPDLAEASGTDVATVKRALNRLEEEGWIFRSRGGGRGHRTTYQLTIPQAAETRTEAVLNRRTGAPLSAHKQAHESQETGAQDHLNRRLAQHEIPRPIGLLTKPSADGELVAGSPPPWVAQGLTWKQHIARALSKPEATTEEETA